MIQGGHCAGLTRAVRHSLSYIAAYSVVGLPLVAVFGLIWGDTDWGNATPFLVLTHLLSVVVVLPTAVAANFVALRVFRPRSWRHESWRAWTAGTVAVFLCWGGTATWLLVAQSPPKFLGEVMGSWGITVYYLGIVVLFSNLALLIAWILPSRARQEIPDRRLK